MRTVDYLDPFKLQYIDHAVMEQVAMVPEVKQPSLPRRTLHELSRRQQIDLQSHEIVSSVGRS